MPTCNKCGKQFDIEQCPGALMFGHPPAKGAISTPWKAHICQQCEKTIISDWKHNPDKGISVITNFGCKNDCWYCVWKNHPLKNVKDPTDWEKLEKFLTEYQYKGKVSVSGGGDPLFNFDNNIEWWRRFRSLTAKLNMAVDIHTRERLIWSFVHEGFWHGINKCVFSTDNLYDDLDYICYLSQFTRVRVLHVVTANTTDNMIESFISKLPCGIQFTAKQLHGFDDNGRYQEIKKKYPNVFCLDDGDYNVYYMPDNSTRHTFFHPENTLSNKG